jgi:hypothetical protein
LGRRGFLFQGSPLPLIQVTAKRWRINELPLAHCLSTSRVTRPLQFRFLGHGQWPSIAGHGEPPRPGTNLTGISEINLIAKARTLDALHGGTPGLGVNGM